MPPTLRPEPSAAVEAKSGPKIDHSLSALLENWQIVLADLSLHHHIDLYDPAILARPWPGIRTMIFSLIDQPDSRLRAALTRR